MNCHINYQFIIKLRFYYHLTWPRTLINYVAIYVAYVCAFLDPNFEIAVYYHLLYNTVHRLFGKIINKPVKCFQ